MDTQRSMGKTTSMLQRGEDVPAAVAAVPAGRGAPGPRPREGLPPDSGSVFWDELGPGEGEEDSWLEVPAAEEVEAEEDCATTGLVLP